ncbi:bifunctional UDP-N-acetylmuramoyl-tripeptide:D-alanyl-D-alanine ligase/alanine racemase [Deminuibacter soli]|uniref:Alanine racemase n=1 Tax=Deminuibacter soli TaxID=2291815 RepID=A0A3E1NP41_9BACT|nr:bifunctional UDP-N-acetylmuramoyl-tripeptide:D-alanyl-D-alanine ligase/alanine racemase [Deminuibacter soli]RFM29699.1 bifunctional UDP-N-acetylmuramoyl-tripeptide:D-alanyl-D-alanine ligase/alanine racemase [Deminuibacter soli]
MNQYTIQQIADVLNAPSQIAEPAALVEYLLTDSRRIAFPQTSLFIALQTGRNDGHLYISEVYNSGVRNFMVRKGFDTTALTGANIVFVNNTLDALQQLAAWHRKQFHYPVIGVTGSNGKTIVKEWLYQLLSPDYTIVRSPRSYNSQTGVPLSVWQMSEQHNLAILEAGISTVHEMARLQAIIQPGIGILTNIGEAHNEGFTGYREKALEKLRLFSNSQVLVYCTENLAQAGIDITGDDRHLLPAGLQLFSWSRSGNATVKLLQEEQNPAQDTTQLRVRYADTTFSFAIPFTDKASVDNAITCCCIMLYLQTGAEKIQQRMPALQAVDMRLQLMKGVNGCYLLNDAYNNDLASLTIALDHLVQQAGAHRKTVILSDIFQAGMAPAQLYRQVAAEISMRRISRFIGIGTQMQQVKHLLENMPDAPAIELYESTDAFLHKVTTHHFRDEYVLLKGARVFAFERISNWLGQKVHQTVMEINLSALVHNLKQYQQELRPGVKLMAMVKAFGYGSGSAEIAGMLQFHKVDYLAVAYADEGVELRKAGISLPILIMNVDEAAFEVLVQYNLEPELFSFGILTAFQQYVRQQGLQQYPVHIKIDTGMHRLGFELHDMEALQALLTQSTHLRVKSVFSHLASSEDPGDDAFTDLQAVRFTEACTLLQQQLGYRFIRHLSNTGGISRRHDLQFDMVRLGIGLYGIDSANNEHMNLQTVATLKTTIAQLRHVPAGDTVGYNRKGKITADSLIATIRIGYADGFGRRFSNGAGQVYINGRLAPVIGNVAMDMTMVNVTGIPGVQENDEVEIFGHQLPVQQVAAWGKTIAYEILTGIGQRVKRIYYED